MLSYLVSISIGNRPLFILDSVGSSRVGLSNPVFNYYRWLFPETSIFSIKLTLQLHAFNSPEKDDFLDFYNNVHFDVPIRSKYPCCIINS